MDIFRGRGFCAPPKKKQNVASLEGERRAGEGGERRQGKEGKEGKKKYFSNLILDLELSGRKSGEMWINFISQ